ncbi:kinase-like domain-containing protein [Mycena olivaceomarginata]|nr:kinase-like domain-containing protein [Mycena olivaceomarginata]
MLDTWRKPFSQNEVTVYQAITPHPRILAFQGLSRYNDYIVLQHHPEGDLWSYLIQKQSSLPTRITWALEAAEGIAHLHSSSVVWADAHLRNILVTHDLHIVLADFAYSIINPHRLHWFTTRPPPIFACPVGYYGAAPTHVNIFGFGVILFALLTNRFPWTGTLTPSDDEQTQASSSHVNGKFDTIDDVELRETFGPVLEKCFKAEYPSGKELLYAMKTASTIWSECHPA